ncbi:MAG: transposase [Bdellovibrionales bacterium]|nr:transposase [Bdellovibrionales bacterium]
MGTSVFQELCDLILLEIRGRTESRKLKKAIREILAIDSSEVRVHGSLFGEPGWKQKYTIGHKAAAKIHVVWNVDGEWIDDFKITPCRSGDSPVSFQLRILPMKMYVLIVHTTTLAFGRKSSPMDLTSRRG